MTQYLGMNRQTGQALADIDHLRQSVQDILYTPIGTRVERRDYGSELPNLIDQPMNQSLRLRIMAAAVAALMRWEPRMKISKIDLQLGDSPATLIMVVHGEIAIDGVSTASVTVPFGVTSPTDSLIVGGGDHWLMADSLSYLRLSNETIPADGLMIDALTAYLLLTDSDYFVP